MLSGRKEPRVPHGALGLSYAKFLPLYLQDLSLSTRALGSLRVNLGIQTIPILSFWSVCWKFSWSWEWESKVFTVIIMNSGIRNTRVLPPLPLGSAWLETRCSSLLAPGFSSAKWGYLEALIHSITGMIKYGYLCKGLGSRPGHMAWIPQMLSLMEEYFELFI